MYLYITHTPSSHRLCRLAYNLRQFAADGSHPDLCRFLIREGAYKTTDSCKFLYMPLFFNLITLSNGNSAVLRSYSLRGAELFPTLRKLILYVCSSMNSTFRKMQTGLRMDGMSYTMLFSAGDAMILRLNGYFASVHQK